MEKEQPWNSARTTKEKQKEFGQLARPRQSGTSAIAILLQF
jgi:hypothetical protein